jgi:predicted acylesterase/phospholipase RssA
MVAAYKNIVLSGGSFKASAFIGCFKYLEEECLSSTIINVIGSSAGAIVGLFICMGYTWKDMREFAAVEAAAFAAREVDIENLFDIFDTLGIEDGVDICKVFERALKYKNPNIDTNINFYDFAKLTGRNLVVCGSNVTRAEIEYFCVDKTPLMGIIDAIRISVALPLVVRPVFLNDMLYVDASLFNNFPIEYFHDTGNPFEDTIALLVSSGDLPLTTSTDINLLSYMNLILDSVFERMNKKEPKLIQTNSSNKIIKILLEDGKSMFDLNTFKLHMDTAILDDYIERGYVVCKENHQTVQAQTQADAVEVVTND